MRRAERIAAPMDHLPAASEPGRAFTFARHAPACEFAARGLLSVEWLAALLEPSAHLGPLSRSSPDQDQLTAA